MIFEKIYISRNIVLKTHVCNFNDKTKIFFSLEKKDKQCIFLTKKNFSSKILQKDIFGRTFVQHGNDKLLISSKTMKKIELFIKKQKELYKKYCYSINEIFLLATNLYLNNENVLSKQNIDKVLTGNLFTSNSLIDCFFKEYLSRNIIRKILFFEPYNYV